MLKIFRRFKYVALSLALLALVAGAADAFSPNPHEWRRYASSARGADDRTQYVPHAEEVVAAGDKIYGLYTLRGGDYPNFSYKAAEIVEFDAELNKTRSVKLEGASGNAGKNAEKMAYHDGKLYVACMGGAQVTGTWGSVWEVNTADMTARRLLDAKTLSAFADAPDALVHSIAVAKDGTAYLLVIAYMEDYSATAKLYVTDVTKLSNGDAGTAHDLTGVGYSWGLAYGEEAQTLWCMTGSELQARDKSGALVKTFTPQDLGNNIGSIAPLADTGSGKPGLFYTASAPDYSGSSTGVVTKDGTAFTVSDTRANYGSDIRAFAYADADGAKRVLVRDAMFTGADTVYVWDVANWTTPILNEQGSYANVHGAVASGQYLYLAAYDRLKADGSIESKGEFVRLDMKNAHKRDKTYGLESVVDGLAKGEAAMASPDLPAGAPANVEAIKPSLVASADF
ncbi:hypothetical protein LJC31_08535, partial [Synergistaceae bacterium OttesenSCG-928-I11]|nr:hypothetical protein [Synergistaceae bacterium OttesenSCG-928-I11]